MFKENLSWKDLKSLTQLFELSVCSMFFKGWVVSFTRSRTIQHSRLITQRIL